MSRKHLGAFIPVGLVPTFALCPSPFILGTVSGEHLSEAQTQAPVTSWEEVRWHGNNLHLGTQQAVPLGVSGQAGEPHIGQLPRVPHEQAFAPGLGARLLACSTLGLSPQWEPVVASVCPTRGAEARGDHAAVGSVYISLNISCVSAKFCEWKNSTEF